MVRGIRAAALTMTTALGLSGAAAAAEFVAPYVQTPQEDVEAMLDLAAVGPGDYLIDLGSGDGRIVITAALRGARGHGVELDRDLVDLAGQRARAAEVGDVTAFLRGDVFEADLRAASVVTLYLMPEVNLRLRPRLLAQLEPGSRVLSNSFDMGDWRPDRTAEARVSGGILMWVVPAQIAGTWSLQAGERTFEMAIEQQFQDFEATLTRGGGQLHSLESTLRGRRIAFAAGDGRDRYVFSGRVDGERMRGTVQVHGVNETAVMPWQARRLPGP